MAIPGFGYRHATLSAAATPSRTFFANGNTARIALMFANPNLGNALVFNDGGSALQGVIALVPANSTLIMPYRDWGEIIRQPIYIGISGGPLTVYCVDLFRIPTEQ